MDYNLEVSLDFRIRGNDYHAHSLRLYEACYKHFLILLTPRALAMIGRRMSTLKRDDLTATGFYGAEMMFRHRERRL